MDQKWGLLAPNPLAGDIYPTVLLRKPLDPILLFAFHFSLFTIHSFPRPGTRFDIWTERTLNRTPCRFGGFFINPCAKRIPQFLISNFSFLIFIISSLLTPIFSLFIDPCAKRIPQFLFSHFSFLILKSVVLFRKM